MKKIKLITIISIIFFLNFAQANSNIVDDENERRVLVLAGDYWCPYNCHPNSEMPGYLVELIKRALYIYRIDVEYRLMPWSQALDLAEKGEIDGLIGISNIEGRNLVTTNLPQEFSDSHAFTRNDTQWIYDGVKSLRGKKVGIILDYVIDEAISHYVGTKYPFDPGSFSVQEGENAVIESIADLIDEDSSVYIEDRRVVEYYIHENGLTPYIRNAGKIGKNPLPVYIAFSKNLPNVNKYIKYFTEGLASLKATGELDDLRIKYQMDSDDESSI